MVTVDDKTSGGILGSPWPWVLRSVFVRLGLIFKCVAEKVEAAALGQIHGIRIYDEAEKHTLTG